ncbi:MAG: hypothetical protein C5B59_08850 [Bacteroidetes bacterium]|nr:MAG: hypothetical protein C5B59_08850 [Bacteroidota bacterium]
MSDVLYLNSQINETSLTPLPSVTGMANNAGVSKTPLFHPPSPEKCACTEFMDDYRFAYTSKTFKCQVHGQATIDRRPLVAPPPLFTSPNGGLFGGASPSFPNTPFAPSGPTWYATTKGDLVYSSAGDKIFMPAPPAPDSAVTTWLTSSDPVGVPYTYVSDKADEPL